MIALIENMSTQRGKELRADAASRRLARRLRRGGSERTVARGEATGVEVRRLDRAGPDRTELERLAGRDSSPAPSGEVVAAERDGQMLAAISLTTGELVADPFQPTADARRLLMDDSLIESAHAAPHLSSELFPPARSGVRLLR